MADERAPAAPPGDLVELGRIVSAYGIRGWVKVQPHSSQAEVLRSAPQWWLTPFSSPLQSTVSPHPKDVVRYDVLQVRPQGSAIVAELKGLNDRNDADALRGQTVSVSRANFPAAPADEFYWVDLIGCQVFGVSADTPVKSDADNESKADKEFKADKESNPGNSRVSTLEKARETPVFLGIVHAVVDNGAHAILLVHRHLASPDGTTECMLDAKGRPMEMLIPFVAAHVSGVDLKARRIDTDWPDVF